MRESVLAMGIITLLVAAPVVAVAQSEPAGGETAVEVSTVVDEPSTPEDVEHDVGELISAVRAGSWIAIAATLITLLVSLFKLPLLGSLVKKIPRRWRFAIPVILGGVAGILANIVGGVSWLEALYVGLFSGPTAVFAHEAVVEAILGQSRSREPDTVS